EDRILLLALAAAVPALLVAMILLWRGDYTSKTQWTVTILIAAVWLGFTFSIRERVTRPLQTLSNILAALREEDYSIRARGARRDEALGEVMIEVNALGDTLKEQRLAQPVERMVGQNAADLGLADCLAGDPARTLQKTFPGQPAATARWGMHRTTFRERGLPHQLLVLSDVSRALREEELQAWQRL